MVHGQVFQVRRDRTDSARVNVSVTNDANIIESYHWFLFRKDDEACMHDESELKAFVEPYKDAEFWSMAFFENKLASASEQFKSNCQCSILEFLSFVTGIGKNKLHAELMITMGTLLNFFMISVIEYFIMLIFTKS